MDESRIFGFKIIRMFLSFSEGLDSNHDSLSHLDESNRIQYILKIGKSFGKLYLDQQTKISFPPILCLEGFIMQNSLQLSRVLYNGEDS
jgi:hypothetical protein